MSVFRKFTTLYSETLIRYPYFSQAVQVSVLAGAGDVLAQTWIERKQLKDLNLQRTGQFAGLGLIFVGPTLRFWYGTLDKLIKTKNPWRRTLQKTALDQLGFAPIFIAAFTSIVGRVQGMTLEQSVHRMQTDYFDILTTNYLIWPPVQLANFRFIPLHFQVIVTQFVALVWNTYLCWKLSQQKNKD